MTIPGWHDIAIPGAACQYGALYALHFGATEAPNHQTAGSGISL